MVKYWIQHADFGSEDLGEISQDGAIQTFQGHDWAAEHAKLQEIAQGGKETCPPGMGFTDDDLGILHICPDADGKAVCFFHTRERIKILGLLPWTLKRTYELLDIPLSSIPNLITAFYEGKVKAFIKSI